MTYITFNNIPSNLRLPGVFAEIDNSQANTGQVNQNTLLIGQVRAVGTAVSNVPILAGGVGDVRHLCGAGSMLGNMYMNYRKSDPLGTVYLLPIDDAPGSTKATVTLTFGSDPSDTPATSPGTLSAYVAGVLVQIPVSTTQTNAQIATALTAAVTAMPDLPCTSTSSTNVCTLHAKNAGVAAGDLDFRLNYHGAANGEVTPTGLVVTEDNAPGSVDPDIGNALANLAGQNFDFIATPYTDAPNIANINDLLSDVSGRWSYLQEIFGGAFSAYRGTYAANANFGNTLNWQHVSVMGFYNSPTPAYIWTSAYTGAAAASLRVDPALPLGGAGDGVVLQGVLAPPTGSQFDASERNTLLFDGISTFVVEQGGAVRVEYAVTTYQVDGAGNPDNSYLDVETLYTLQFLVRDLRTDLAEKFSRKKLVADGTRIPYGVNFCTSQTVLNEAIANYRKNAALGLCQSPDEFAKTAYSNNQGNGTVALFLPINVANQLRRIEMLVSFLKS